MGPNVLLLRLPAQKKHAMKLGCVAGHVYELILLATCLAGAVLARQQH